MVKKIGILVLSFIFIANIFAQKGKGSIKLSGKIENKTSKNVVISNTEGFSKTISVSETGEFSADLKEIKEGMYSFSDGRESSKLYLKNGYDLNITLNTEQFDETIKYTGKGAGNNNFLAQKYLINEKEFIDLMALYKLTEEEFLKKYEEANKKYNALLNTLKDKTFVDYQKKSINYDYLAAIIVYEPYHQYVIKDNDYKVSKNFLKNLDGVDYTIEQDYINFESYQKLLAFYYLGNFESESKIKETLVLISKLESDIIKSDLKAAILQQFTIANENIELINNIIQKECDDEDFKKQIAKTYKDLSSLRKGHPSAKFAYEDVNGKVVKLDDLKGKYVYIDVWATWCRPCLGEIPHLKKLEKEYHGKNIAFVSISVDNQKAYEKWKKMVADKELKGYQLFADKSWGSDFIQAYKIKGIPTFILIDPKGNIHSASAMRPSNPAIRGLFDELLE